MKRHKVGEADPATRKRMLAEALRPGPPVKSAPRAASGGPSMPDDVDVSLVNAYRKLKGRGRDTNRVVDSAEDVKRITQ